jgi:hypothetical protein
MSNEKDNDYKITLPDGLTFDETKIAAAGDSIIDGSKIHTYTTSDSVTISDGSYTTYVPCFNSGIDRFLFENFNMEPVSKIDTCTSCNKPDSNIKITYKVFSIDRNICHKCCGSLVDKLFGANVNIDTEELLYKEDNEKNS